MSKLKKLETKKLSPVRRSSVAMAHSLRGGAGAGLHRDKSKYTRKPKHKTRFNPGPPAGVPAAKWEASVREFNREVNQTIGKAVSKASAKFGIFKNTKPDGKTYEDSSPWAMAYMKLGDIMAASPYASMTEESMLFDDKGNVIPPAHIIDTIMTPILGESLNDPEVKELYNEGVSALTEKMNILRGQALEVIEKGEASASGAEKEDDEAFKASLISRARAQGNAELAEAIKRGVIKLDEAEDILGEDDEEIEGDEEEEEEAPAPPPKREARAAPTPRTETQQQRGQERAGRTVEAVRVAKDKQTIPAEPTHLRGIPLELERFTVARRDLAAGPSPAIIERAKKDVLLWALDNGDTQVWAKGSCIVTFQAKGSGKSSPQIAAQYAVEWRKGKKSRYSARILVGVQGHDDLVVKAESLDAMVRQAAAPGNPEQVAESIKMNPRYRRNAKIEQVWGGVRFNPFDFAGLFGSAKKHGATAVQMAKVAATKAQIAAERSRYRDAYNTLDMTYTEIVEAARRGDKRAEEAEEAVLSEVIGLDAGWKGNRRAVLSRLKAGKGGIFALEAQLAELEQRKNPHRRNGESSDHTASPLHSVLETHGWVYSHSTPMHRPGGVVTTRHSYVFPSDAAGKKYPRIGFDGSRWSGSMGGSGSEVMGRSAADLAEYLKGARSRGAKKNPHLRNPSEFPGITLTWRPSGAWASGQTKFFPAHTERQDASVISEYREAAQAALAEAKSAPSFPEIEVTISSGQSMPKTLPWLEETAKWGARSKAPLQVSSPAIRRAIGLKGNPKGHFPSITSRMPKPHKVSLPSIYIPVHAPKKGKK